MIHQCSLAARMRLCCTVAVGLSQVSAAPFLSQTSHQCRLFALASGAIAAQESQLQLVLDCCSGRSRAAAAPTPPIFVASGALSGAHWTIRVFPTFAVMCFWGVGIIPGATSALVRLVAGPRKLPSS